MDKKEGIKQIGLNLVKTLNNIDYIDDNIVFHRDLRDLPIENGSMRMDLFAIAACTKGILHLELNTNSYTLHQNEALICRPNDIIDNFMISPDFDGGVLCLSQKDILKKISESDLWHMAFRISKNPIIRVSEKSLSMFHFYGAILNKRVAIGKTPYHKEIITAIVTAILYEMLANIEIDPSQSFGPGLVKQREVLFKRFIDLLSETKVKPRNVSWYADRLCITSKYLSTISKQISGKTAFDWISEYVLTDIRYWLKNSNKSIKEVADILDFPNISFFGKYCRSHFGVSPTKLRRQLRNRPNDSQ